MDNERIALQFELDGIIFAIKQVQAILSFVKRRKNDEMNLVSFVYGSSIKVPGSIAFELISGFLDELECKRQQCVEKLEIIAQ